MMSLGFPKRAKQSRQALMYYHQSSISTKILAPLVSQNFREEPPPKPSCDRIFLRKNTEIGRREKDRGKESVSSPPVLLSCSFPKLSCKRMFWLKVVSSPLQLAEFCSPCPTPQETFAEHNLTQVSKGNVVLLLKNPQNP